MILSTSRINRTLITACLIASIEGISAPSYGQSLVMENPFDQNPTHATFAAIMGVGGVAAHGAVGIGLLATDIVYGVQGKWVPRWVGVTENIYAVVSGVLAGFLVKKNSARADLFGGVLAGLSSAMFIHGTISIIHGGPIERETTQRTFYAKLPAISVQPQRGGASGSIAITF